MPGITSVNSRESLPKGMQYPLRWADIEAALEPSAEHEIFVQACFWRSASLAARTEENTKMDKYDLAMVLYDPKIPEWSSGPWDDVDDSILVRAHVHAIPTWLAKEVTPRRPVLRKLLCDRIPRLMAKSLNEKPFKLVLNLRLDPARIQVCTQIGMAGEAGSHESSTETLLTELNRSLERER